MNPTMVYRLVAKDWYLNRVAIAGFGIGGVVALGLMRIESYFAFYAGCILLISAVMAIGIQLAMATVIYERTQHTLPFVMSLPVTPADYTMAKILANLALFLAPWLLILFGAVSLILFTPAIPDGMLPFTVLVMGELFVGYLLVLATAIVTESQGWTIGAIVTTNLLFQWFLYAVSHLPSIAAGNKSEVVSWGGAATWVALAEVLVAALLVWATFAIQGRKRDFL